MERESPSKIRQLHHNLCPLVHPPADICARHTVSSGKVMAVYQRLRAPLNVYVSRASFEPSAKTLIPCELTPTVTRSAGGYRMPPSASASDKDERRIVNSVCPN